MPLPHSVRLAQHAHRPGHAYPPDEGHLALGQRQPARRHLEAGGQLAQPQAPAVLRRRLGGQTPAQHRRGLRLRKLPASFEVPTGRLPLAEGQVTFIRRVSVAGTVSVLSQSYRVGKRHRGLYLRLVVDTGRGQLTAYLNGRVLKRWPYKLLND